MSVYAVPIYETRPSAEALRTRLLSTPRRRSNAYSLGRSDGMPGPAGSGPRGASCGGCANFGFVISDSVWGRCRERTRIAGQIGPAVPISAPACWRFHPIDDELRPAFGRARANGASSNAAFIDHRPTTKGLISMSDLSDLRGVFPNTLRFNAEMGVLAVSTFSP
jgi:hypothetical protein